MPGDEHPIGFGSPSGGAREPGKPAPVSGGAEGTLIVGYGNALRGDDGLGWHAVERLAGDPRLRRAQVLWRHQLTADLADDLSNVALAVLIDINVGGEAGAVTVRRLDREPDSGSAWSHHLEPGALVALARELFGAAPSVFLVSVGAASLEIGDRLSPAVQRALPEVVDAVVAIVAEHGVGSGNT